MEESRLSLPTYHDSHLDHNLALVGCTKARQFLGKFFGPRVNTKKGPGTDRLPHPFPGCLGFSRWTLKSPYPAPRWIWKHIMIEMIIWWERRLFLSNGNLGSVRISRVPVVIGRSLFLYMDVVSNSSTMLVSIKHITVGLRQQNW